MKRLLMVLMLLCIAGGVYAKDYEKEIAATYRIVLCTDGNFMLQKSVQREWYEWSGCHPLNDIRNTKNRTVGAEAENARAIDRIPRVFMPLTVVQ
jgi:hypothetical protein